MRYALLGLVLLVLLVSLSAAGVAAAQSQMYKWKDAAGVTHYSDTAPPPSRDAKILHVGAAAVDGAALPYELARAVRAYPVVLYTTTRCEGCALGRSLLRGRGIPYAEKTVTTEADREQLLQIGGKNTLPLLVVGTRQVAGFQAVAWNEALDGAAYPRTSGLPPGYQTGVVTAAAPVVERGPAPVLPSDAVAARPEAMPAPAPQKTIPPAFQF